MTKTNFFFYFLKREWVVSQCKQCNAFLYFTPSSSIYRNFLNLLVLKCNEICFTILIRAVINDRHASPKMLEKIALISKAKLIGSF